MIYNKKNIIALAPMAGYSDSAMRQMCKSFGADLVFTEMVSADAIYHNKKLTRLSHPEQINSTRYEFREGSRDSSSANERIQNDIKKLISFDKTLNLMKFKESERPIVVQLFGKYPEKFAYAAKWVEDNIKPDGIDINMGCPAKKVIKSDHGAALLKNPDLACKIVEAVKSQISIPLSVKTRLGWRGDDEILEFGPKLIKAGADTIIVHGRTYKDGFSGKARWGNIYELKKQITKNKLQTNIKSLVHRTIILWMKITNHKQVAVIGNGDIKSYKEAVERMKSGGVELDGVMIGRTAFGKPWVFGKDSRITNNELRITILDHAKLVYEDKGEHGIIEFRKHLLAYLRGFSGAKELRKQAVKVKMVKDVERLLSG